MSRTAFHAAIGYPRAVHPDVRPLESLVPRKAAAFGGKARGLATLIRAGYSVPAGFAVASAVANEAFIAGLEVRDRIESLVAGTASAVTWVP